MAQISLPLRVALVAVVAASALWLTILKPKPAAEPSATVAPGVTGLAGDVAAAKGAATASDTANAQVQAATDGTTATSTSTSTSTARGTRSAAAGKTATASGTTAAQRSDLSTPLLRSLDRGNAVVLLFWSRRAADDRAVRDAVAATNRRGGKVTVTLAPTADVARYARITRGAPVLESPTTLVIGPGHKAHAIVGLTTTGEVDQAVADALRAAKKK